MKEIPFYKTVASGNDFVVIDNRKKVVTDPVSFAREVCDRHTGVGADGVLLVENVGAGLAPAQRRVPLAGVPTNTERPDYKVRILNADGSEAEACGNGFRCIALWAHKELGLPSHQRFETLGGVIDAEVRKEGRVRVRLAEPSDFRDKQMIEVGGRKLHYYFLRIGNPHAVIFVEGLDKIPVFEIGREIRYHAYFQPAGANVNFVEVKGPQAIEVRTYERGVENETLACGTGSTASAIVSVMAGYTQPPVQVKTKSEEVLTIDFGNPSPLPSPQRGEGRVRGILPRQVYLGGEAKLVFKGEWKS